MIEYRASVALRNGQTRERRGKDRAGLVEEVGTALSEMSGAGARLTRVRVLLVDDVEWELDARHFGALPAACAEVDRVIMCAP